MTAPVASLASTVDARRRLRDIVFRGLLYAALGIALGTLLVLLVDTVNQGRPKIGMDLYRNFPSARPARAGIQSAVYGSLWVVGITALLSLPLGVGTAVYLEEYARQGRWYNRLIELNIQNLAAVPSIVYGILGLAFIARGPLGWGPTIRTAALTLTLVVLPTVIISSREALRAVPPSLRQGALALGATRWQAIWRQVLPGAAPGIATGSILAVSRALGESAPLLLLGGLAFISFNPPAGLGALDSAYTVLPIQVFQYATDARQEFHMIAAATIVVLLAMLLFLNGLAIFIRNKYQRKW
ncbi:MAG TPA: phosphate ABC transporter permease PstA [Acidimicrobiales bacterium]|nr:phosphate ABC transporter permease PstA [Acidimicrobiales bacterium]